MHIIIVLLIIRITTSARNVGQMVEFLSSMNPALPMPVISAVSRWRSDQMFRIML